MPTEPPHRYHDFAPPWRAPTALRAAITAACRRPETDCLPPLIAAARLPPAMAAETQALAARLAGTLREQKTGGGREGLVQSLIQEFSLSSQEGVALMCLAEALLRIPDAATRDALIRDKIGHGNWQAHLGHSPSLFVNAATWGLLLTGRLVATHNETGLTHVLAGAVRRSGEPIIRKAVDLALRLMGDQFVTGETIEAALDHARRYEAMGFRYSYDMLGEAALTEADAARYLAAYRQAIHAIGRASAGRGIQAGPGISIKLSALHPRYSRAQIERARAELYPRLRDLVLLARFYEIGINIDAEEADRLELSLDLLETLCAEPGLAAWDGVGFVVQAYQKRCPFVIASLIDLARRSHRRLMVRLVKGAYWDSEIKRAQQDGLDGYPVYTRKLHTDVAYLACARQLLAAPDAVYPQFATHNAQTLAAVYHMAGPDYRPGQYEFQCLHGMGEPLYQQVVGAGKLDRPCRIYAPVGTHETLLAYLVRRLLENGANTSFVHRIADPAVPLEELVGDPVAAVEDLARASGAAVGLPHSAIPLPRALFGGERANSRSIDLANEDDLTALSHALQSGAAQCWQAAPLIGGIAQAGVAQEVRNPADRRDVVGTVVDARLQDIEDALMLAVAAGRDWQDVAAADRAAILDRAADLLEERRYDLIGLLMREAGKTAAAAIAEVREAVDFLRYDAAQIRRHFAAAYRPLGPVACISPWNFPLAIFVGQIAAALAAGNSVLAKPAEQTPLIAAEAVRLLHEAGVPAGVLALLPGPGESVGAALVADERVRAVLFTGSTAVARLLQRQVALRLDPEGRPIPLIAETGGQNAMIVDSSALAEQVVADVMTSAFDSAGQRCSALRLLCLQDDGAARVLTMLEGAIAELRVGNPACLATDVGPVIDAAARQALTAYLVECEGRGNIVRRVPLGDATGWGTFVAPSIVELNDIAELGPEMFGPILHVLRYRRGDLDQVIERINRTGYGLTQGVQTRIDETIAHLVARSRAGNLYVNRNMVGAVVGVQPFGGEGLSGTGPKAGGPLYMLRLLAACPCDAGRVAVGSVERTPGSAAFLALRAWAAARPRLAACCAVFAEQLPVGIDIPLPGPTGERNIYRLHPRDMVLCLADDPDDLLVALAALLAVGSRAVWAARPDLAPVLGALPGIVRAQIRRTEDWPAASFDAVLHHGSAESCRALCQTIAARPGPIIGIQSLPPGDDRIRLDRLVVERVVSINTAAAGGNASLMTIG